MKRFAVIGLGNFGFHTAKALFEDGNEVVAIDIDKGKIQAIDPYSTEAIVMNATDKDALKAMGLEDMDGVIVSTGTKISISILICLYLQEIGVKKILVKALDEDHGKILRRVGATEIIHPERDMALRVSKGLSRPNILDFIPLADEFDLVQVDPPREFIGKSLTRAESAGQIQCAYHRHQGACTGKFYSGTPGKFYHKRQRHTDHAGEV